MSDETRKNHLRLVYSGEPDQAGSEDVIDVDDKHHEAAERIMNSALVKDLLGLELSDRKRKLGELSTAAKLPEGIDVDRDTCAVLSDFGWVEWGYLGESLKEGPTARVYDTAQWIVANALARYEKEQPDPDAA